MAYTVQSWADLPDTSTPITAARLAHIETGIFNAAATADAGGASGGVTSVNTKTGAVTLAAADVGADASGAAAAAQTAAVAAAATAGDARYILGSKIHAASGVALLDGSGDIVADQLPSGSMVLSVNGLRGDVIFSAADIGAATPSDIANAVVKVGYYIFYAAGWPTRSTTPASAIQRVNYVGGTAATPPPIGGTGAINDVDAWEYLG